MKLESEIGSIITLYLTGITLILILFSNYFAINYFANFIYPKTFETGEPGLIYKIFFDYSLIANCLPMKRRGRL